MKDQELPQSVNQLLETLENDVARKIAKATLAFKKSVSQFLDDFGSQIPESEGELFTTPKVQVLNGGVHYAFWVEEKYKQGVDDQKVKQTILYVLPEDETEAYEMITVEGGTIFDVGDNELDEVGELESLCEVLSFLREELDRSKAVV